MEKQAGDVDERSGESPAERADRNFGDLLQELRVTQTGVQILFAFLLTLVFQQRFTELDRVAVIIYVVTVVFCVVAAAFLIAPVPLHRRMFGLNRKAEVVKVSAKEAKTGMAFLGAAIVGATMAGPGHGTAAVAGRSDRRRDRPHAADRLVRRTSASGTAPRRT